jgi:small subunit ribosomal protein S17
MTDTKTVEKKVQRKRLEGVVVSNKMMKTVVVEVSRFVKHPKYGKFQSFAKRHNARSEEDIELGTKVVIEECRPLSKNTHFIVVEK